MDTSQPMETNARPAVLEVGGMTCEDCAHHVTAALEGAGAERVSVAVRTGEARFSVPGGLAEDALRAAVEGAGYRPGALRLLGTGISKKGAVGDVDYDLVVVGAGSAAFAAAIKATEAGYRVALVEHATVGGTCVNVGCVPSKALLRAGEAAWAAGHHPFAGLSTSSGPVDLAAMVAQKDELVGDLRQMKYADLVADYGFTVIPGHGRFTSPEVLEVDSRSLRGRGYLASTSALELTRIPRRLVVIGANAIGLDQPELVPRASRSGGCGATHDGTPAVRDRVRLRRGVDIGSGVPAAGGVVFVAGLEACAASRRWSRSGRGMCDLRGEHTCARVPPRPADRCGVPGAHLRPLRRLCQGKEGRPHGAGATLAHAATPAACSATIDTASPTSSATRGSVTW